LKDPKVILYSHMPREDMAKGKVTKEQTMICETLQRKLKIEHHELH
jgi:alanine racemase